MRRKRDQTHVFCLYGCSLAGLVFHTHKTEPHNIRDCLFMSDWNQETAYTTVNPDCVPLGNRKETTLAEHFTITDLLWVSCTCYLNVSKCQWIGAAHYKGVLPHNTVLYMMLKETRHTSSESLWNTSLKTSHEWNKQANKQVGLKQEVYAHGNLNTFAWVYKMKF